MTTAAAMTLLRVQTRILLTPLLVLTIGVFVFVLIGSPQFSLTGILMGLVVATSAILSGPILFGAEYAEGAEGYLATRPVSWDTVVGLKLSMLIVYTLVASVIVDRSLVIFHDLVQGWLQTRFPIYPGFDDNVEWVGGEYESMIPVVWSLLFGGALWSSAVTLLCKDRVRGILYGIPSFFLIATIVFHSCSSLAFGYGLCDQDSVFLNLSRSGFSYMAEDFFMGMIILSPLLLLSLFLVIHRYVRWGRLTISAGTIVPAVLFAAYFGLAMQALSPTIQSKYVWSHWINAHDPKRRIVVIAEDRGEEDSLLLSSSLQPDLPREKLLTGDRYRIIPEFHGDWLFVTKDPLYGESSPPEVYSFHLDEEGNVLSKKQLDLPNEGRGGGLRYLVNDHVLRSRLSYFPEDSVVKTNYDLNLETDEVMDLQKFVYSRDDYYKSGASKPGIQLIDVIGNCAYQHRQLVDGLMKGYRELIISVTEAASLKEGRISYLFYDEDDRPEYRPLLFSEQRVAHFRNGVIRTWDIGDVENIQSKEIDIPKWYTFVRKNLPLTLNKIGLRRSKEPETHSLFHLGGNLVWYWDRYSRRIFVWEVSEIKQPKYLGNATIQDPFIPVRDRGTQYSTSTPHRKEDGSLGFITYNGILWLEFPALMKEGNPS